MFLVASWGGVHKRLWHHNFRLWNRGYNCIAPPPFGQYIYIYFLIGF
jgi:hypothetical protein